jgi:hypothetical protein
MLLLNKTISAETFNSRYPVKTRIRHHNPIIYQDEYADYTTSGPAYTMGTSLVVVPVEERKVPIPVAMIEILKK